MSSDSFDLHEQRPEIAVLDKLAVVERACLALVTATVAVNGLEWFTPLKVLSSTGGWRPMSPYSVVAAACCTIGLHFSRRWFSRRVHQLTDALLVLVAAASAAVVLCRSLIAVSSRAAVFFAEGATDWPHAARPASMQASACFTLLAIAIYLLRFDRKAARLAEEICVFLLIFLVAILASSQVIGSLAFFGPLMDLQFGAQTMLCLCLLSLVVLARQAKRGVFSVFLGRGSGSRLARTLFPLLVLFPFLREGLRMHLISTGRIPPHYMVAVLASVASSVSLAVLIYLGRRFNAMEVEIENLSLRDELTGLYNLRGFRFLAQQAFLLARRSMHPFSVLYVDLDGLKQINDVLGHEAGSNYLRHTGTILREAFRETDVVARIGGDEFAMAGMFDRRAIAEAAQRLRECAVEYNRSAKPEIPLRFSLGFVTSSVVREEALEDLLARADEAMYQEKRSRKAQREGMGLPAVPMHLSPRAEPSRSTAVLPPS